MSDRIEEFGKEREREKTTEGEGGNTRERKKSEKS